ncbi:hypothetical protein [Burkholderia sp. BE17]|uniref:hypothetical protein n=1 Tax=Burkholderia sp. BE17 TaxID=2656644 RepID=UPI00128C770B|nr:hypothetical protein [Burkholderia sp. BE17]MPV66399.1 hypothetical protein [Burkholderia sp. BE17]
MSTPQLAIQNASSICTTTARALLAHGEMLACARPDSAIVRQAQISLRRLAVELDNAAIGLQQARLLGGDGE